MELPGLAVPDVGDDGAWVDPLGAIFQTGQHASGPIPRPGSVGEFTDQALLAPGALVVAFEDFLRWRNACLKALVACQADDVLHATALAPAYQALTAEPRVATDDDVHLGPYLA